MKFMFAISIVLFFIIIWNIDCLSVSTVSKTPANHTRDTVLSDGNKNNDTMKKQIELRISTKETTCKKMQSCKILLDIENFSDNDVSVGALNILLRPNTNNTHVDERGYLDSPVDVITLENLQPNQPSLLTIKGNQHLEKVIDIEKIKWLKRNQSSWNYSDLWEQINEGKYQISVELGLNIKVDDSFPKKGKIGNTEVEFQNYYKVISNFLKLDFKQDVIEIGKQS
jgi:hypothetical protein